MSLCLLSSHKKVGRGGGAERPPGGSRSQVQQLASGAAGPAAKKSPVLAGGRKPHLFKKKSRGKSCAGVVIFAIIESVCRAAAKKKLFLPGKGKGLKQRSHRQRKQRQGGNGEEATARRQRRGGRVRMDVRVGDILVMKKNHPCGENKFLVLRSGMDFKLRCTRCGREVMIARSKAEKNIRQIQRPGAEPEQTQQG